MKRMLFASLMLSITYLLPAQVKSGHEISLTIKGLADSTIYMGYHYGDKQYIKDTIRLDKTGSGKFSGREKLDQGIYLIVLPGQTYFEMLMTEDQIFSLSCSFKDYFNTLSFTGSEDNAAFIDYQRDWMVLQKNASSLGKRIQANKDKSDSLKILRQMQTDQEKKMKDYLRSVEDSNKGRFLATLVKAMRPVEIPEFVIPAVTKNPDSVRWIKTNIYYKDHFFDNIDLHDERLLRTPILYGKINEFFTNPFIQAPDSINKEIDRFLKKVDGSYKIFQFAAVYLFNHFRESEIMGHDAVMVKLADDIYLTSKADWVSKEFKDDLRKQIDLIRPNLIGMKAENLIMDSYKGIHVALHDIEKDFTILIFWEPDCGHCKEVVPKLKVYYDKEKGSGIEVFAVCTTADKVKWTKFIEDNKLTWINGWDPERKSNFDYYYNVQTTPMIYILDRNKKIIAKKLSVESIGPFLESYRKLNKI
jgi:thiol-disulfide isomerase/thioredoxin